VRIPPPGPDHGYVEGNVYLALALYVRSQDLGEVYVGETGWDLTRRGERRETVLASDVAVVRAEQLPLTPPRRGQTYRPIAPDLVVEVASPSQYRPDLADKARQWLDRGVRTVWVIWPERHEVDVWIPGATEPSTLRDDETLEGGEVIPGFQITLGQLW
jgi:Uma2 family endonuclease